MVLSRMLRKAVKRSIRFAPIPVVLTEKLLFLIQLGYWPNFDDPTSFCEKLHARKLRERDERLVNLSDKLKVRDYVANKIGDQYLIPLIYAGDSIDPESLIEFGNDLVIKRNDDSGSAFLIRENTRKIATEACRSVISRGGYGKSTNEWWYGQIPPKILIEERLSDPEQGDRLIEYKFFVFGSLSGAPQVLLEVIRRSEGGRVECGFFDSELRPVSRSGQAVKYRGCPLVSCGLPSKALFAEMKSIALTLSEGFNFVRVDLYAVSGQVYFSELTFNPAEGRFRVSPVEFDFELGQRWELPILLEGRCPA